MDSPLWLVPTALLAGLLLLHLYPLTTGRPLPNWRWMRPRRWAWPPRHVRLAALGIILVVLGVALVFLPAQPDSTIGAAKLVVGVVVVMLGSVLANVAHAHA
jgi:DMSO reductase anchor subunit